VFPVGLDKKPLVKNWPQLASSDPAELTKMFGNSRISQVGPWAIGASRGLRNHRSGAIGRAWSWRRRMDAGEFATIQELAETVGLVERHVSRKLRLPELAP